MSCYHPLTGLVFGVNPETGKKIVKVVPKDFNGVSETVFPDVERIPIPCGRCIGCRLARSRQWADRCMLESYYHNEVCFLTLTYDDAHLPSKRKDSPFHSLDKKDMQLFMKRLRKAYPDKKIRFFGCGEYGSESMRPHMHLILFGIDFHEDRKYLRSNFRGDKYYTSDMLLKTDAFGRPVLDEKGEPIGLWPKGYHIIAPFDWDCAAYVARYVMKKQYGKDASIYEEQNFEPEFNLMSRKPGIGRQYFEDHMSEIYKTQEIFLATAKGSKKIRPPRYYDKLYDIEYPDHMAAIRFDRQDNATHQMNARIDLIGLDYSDILELDERKILSKTKILKRKEI